MICKLPLIATFQSRQFMAKTKLLGEVVKNY